MRQRRRTWRTLATTASLTVAAVALTGCGGTATDAKSAPKAAAASFEGKGPINYVSNRDASGAANKSIEEWNAAHPEEGHVHRTAGLRGPAAPAAHPERPDQVGHLQRAEPGRRLDLRVRRQQVDPAAARGRDPHGHDDPRHRQRRDVPGHPGGRPVLHRRRAVLLPLGPAQGRRHRRPAQDLGRDEDRLQGHPGPPRRPRACPATPASSTRTRPSRSTSPRPWPPPAAPWWTPRASPPSTPPRPRRA